MADREKINKPLILPQSKVPPKSNDLRSAFNALGNGKFCEKLDQLRARYGVQGQKQVDRLDGAITFLVLDMGCDAEEVQEMLEQASSQIVAEANLHSGGKF